MRNAISIDYVTIEFFLIFTLDYLEYYHLNSKEVRSEMHVNEIVQGKYDLKLISKFFFFQVSILQANNHTNVTFMIDLKDVIRINYDGKQPT